MPTAQQEISDALVIPYKEIPHISNSITENTSGNLIVGTLNKTRVVILQGNHHLFEGHTPLSSMLLIRTLSEMGLKTLVITTVAGSLNDRYLRGEIMLISDHMNFTGMFPPFNYSLHAYSPHFPNLFDIYTPRLQNICSQTASNLHIKLCKGVYAKILGPSYATRAQLRLFANGGCDATGMAIANEASVAGNCGLELMALAVLTDMALPNSNVYSTEDEMRKAGNAAITNLKTLLINMLPQI